MDRRDCTLDLIRAGPPHEERLLDELTTLVDLGTVPLGPILIPEQHEIAFIADACLAPRVMEQHEAQKADGLRLVWKEGRKTAREAKSILDEVRTHQSPVRTGHVALVE